MNINDLLGAATDATQANTTTQSPEGNESESGSGLSDIMNIAKDFDMAELEKYKSMPKMELLQELKNSEHSETVINYLKGLIDSK